MNDPAALEGFPKTLGSKVLDAVLEREATRTTGIGNGLAIPHGFSAVGEAPVRWIEAQAPLPPAANGFFFHDDWLKLTNLG